MSGNKKDPGAPIAIGPIDVRSLRRLRGIPTFF